MKDKYTVNEPENFGKFPVRTEINVLPADELSKVIGWKIEKGYHGTEICLADDENQNPLESLHSIIIGSKIIVHTLVGSIKMTVTKLNKRKGQAESKGTIALLEFDSDDRHCWVSSSSINKRF